jgi:hypothetical protein
MVNARKDDNELEIRSMQNETSATAVDALALRLRESLDRQDIREVLVRWNRALDRGDARMMASTYSIDAQDDHGKHQYRSSDEAANDYIERHVRAARRTMHTTVQEFIELEGDVAHCESYAIAYLVTDRVPSLENRNNDRPCLPIEELLVTVGIRYIDRFERLDAQWKIAKRKMILEWRTFSDSVPLAFDVPDQHIGFSWHPVYQGARSHDDPAYRMAATLAAIGSAPQPRRPRPEAEAS